MIRRSHAAIVILLAVQMAGSLSGHAASPAIVFPLERELEAQATAPVDPTVIRSRHVVFAADTLPSPPADGQPATPGGTLLLDLFDNVSVVAVFERFDPNPRATTWVGRVQGSEGSRVTLVYGADGLVHGNILTLDGTYTIQPAPDAVRQQVRHPAGQLHVVTEIDPSKRRGSSGATRVTIGAADGAGVTAQSDLRTQFDTGDFIDLLVVYTTAAASYIGGSSAIRSRIDLMVSQTNTSYADSGVTQRLRLSHVAEVAYAASSDQTLFTDLENLRGGAPGLEGVAALRDLHNADLVMMISVNPDPFAACGNGYHMAEVGAAFAPFGFSITDIICTSTAHTFAEVLASNMGLRAEWFRDNATTPYTYAHAHVNPNIVPRFYTLMGSYYLCNEYNLSCAGLMRWSNPDQTLSGRPLGVAAGTRSNCALGALDSNTCDADSRLALNNTAPVVANFRLAPVAPPSPFSKNSPAHQAVLGTGFTTLSWQFAPFAASYEYCVDTTNNAACDGAWTPTTALSVNMTVIPGTTYYWQVRAVNSQGATQANGGTWWSYSRPASPPLSFNKSSPFNGRAGQAASQTLSWNASVDAGWYEYCYDTSHNATCDGSWIVTNATSVALTLQPGTVYSWQVRAVNPSATVEADLGMWWVFATTSPSPQHSVTTLAGLAGAAGSTDATGSAARFNFPYGVAVDSTGTVWVAEPLNNRVRKVTSAGVVTTLTAPAGSFSGPQAIALDSSDTAYVANTSNHTIMKITAAGVVTTFAGGAGLTGSTDATGTAARFSSPYSVAVDATGSVYVADAGNHTIRKITPAGEVTTLAGLAGASGTADGTGNAARFSFPCGVAVDVAGTVYVADTNNFLIRRITPAGVVTTVAGQAASQGDTDGVGNHARFRAPRRLAVDAAGTIYVVDQFGHRIRMVTPQGAVTTLAGSLAGSADGVGSVARFSGPNGVAVSANGVLYVGDTNNHTIRRWGPVADLPNLIANGDFSAGTANWQTFATPSPAYISTAVVNGVLEFTRVAPPPGTANQATVYQNTGQAFAAGTPLLAQFALGNSSSVRKRVSVLVLDHDFSDLSVCTFWLPANLPLTTYAMRTYTTEAWTNASVYFYAATAGANGGAYRLDNVGLYAQPGGPVAATTCLDPMTPAATTESSSSELLGNGAFTTGTLAPWGVFGTITHQIVAGVFEFIRPSNTPPAGVLLQPTGLPATPNQILTATFQLGNSSAVRKRVTVLLHDSNFSDLSACTFWIPPGQALTTYTYRTYATQAWANATISFYPATTDLLEWIRLDNVSLRRTPGTAITGAHCVEPGGS